MKDFCQELHYAADDSAVARWILHKWVPSANGVRGHWIVKCSLCRRKSDVETDRCYACGAKMML